MQRVKTKKKKSRTHRPAKTPFEIVRMTNYYNLAVMVRTLALVNKFTDDEIFEFCKSYAVLLEEVSDGRTSIWTFINDTKEMTGIDVIELLDDVCKSFIVQS